jgi:hypothetical protein
MISRLAMLSIAGAASVAAIGGAAHAQPALTQTCAFKAGPLDGQTIDFTGIPGVVAVPVGDRCADMQGSSGVAVIPQGAPQAAPQVTPQGTAREQGQGRFYTSPGGAYTSPGAPGTPGYYSRPGYYGGGGYYTSPGAPLAGAPLAWGSASGQRCRFTQGPAAGATLDYSHTLGAAPLAIGAPCADGASSGFIVRGPRT